MFLLLSDRNWLEALSRIASELVYILFNLSVDDNVIEH